MRKYIRDGRAPIPRNEKTSRTMSAIRAKNTKPEMRMRELLSKAKIKGYRLHWKNVAGRPDIAFSKKKVAIFVHGCYWHACPRCRLQSPKTHKVFWNAKFERNKERDARKGRELKRSGWRVVTVWEHQIKKSPDRVVERVKKVLHVA